jgi:hypothetical protein
MTFYKSDIVISIISNYRRSGVIEPNEVEAELISLFKLSDKELMSRLIESHVIAESKQSIENYRCLN